MIWKTAEISKGEDCIKPGSIYNASDSGRTIVLYVEGINFMDSKENLEGILRMLRNFLGRAVLDVNASVRPAAMNVN